MNKGNFYETKAREYLKIKGYDIIRRNFSTKFGEIDIIAKDKNYLCFIEVRARNKNYLVSPEESIDYRKQNRLVKSAQIYISKMKRRTKLRFDVVTIRDCGSIRIYSLIKDAF